jgi:hypothetical protein
MKMMILLKKLQMYAGELPENDNNYFKIACLAMVHRCHYGNYNEKMKVVLPAKKLFGWKLCGKLKKYLIEEC